MKINSSSLDFQEVVNNFLTEYSTDVTEATYEAIDEVSKEAVKKLKAANKGKKKWKKYPRGWTRKIETGKSRVGVTVYGKKGTYQLAHLLEFGHQLRKGGRKVGEAGAFPHIQEINDWAMDEVTGRIIEKME